jgi:hypothetical protein
MRWIENRQPHLAPADSAGIVHGRAHPGRHGRHQANHPGRNAQQGSQQAPRRAGPLVHEVDPLAWGNSRQHLKAAGTPVRSPGGWGAYGACGGLAIEQERGSLGSINSLLQNRFAASILGKGCDP